MKILSKAHILILHEQLISEFGGSLGVRDEGLLESAIYSPMHTFGGVEFYPTIIDKSVRLGYGLINAVYEVAAGVLSQESFHEWVIDHIAQE